MTTQFYGNTPITNPIVLPNNNIQAAYAATTTTAPNAAPQNTTCGMTAMSAPPAPAGCGGNLNVTA